MPATVTPPAAPAAAPAPKPAAAPAPAKPAAPPPKPADAPLGDMSDAFADLDDLDKGKQPTPKREAARVPPSREKEAQETSRDVKSAETEEASTTGTEGESAAPASPESGPTKDTTEPKPVKAKELREAYEGLKKRVQSEYEPKLKELEAKVREYETRSPEDAKAVTERLASIEKRNAELEQQMRFVDYSKSKEFQEQYWKPHVQAWENATRELKGLTMTVEDPKTGEASVREVTQADLQYFASLDPAVRRTEINRLFPDDKEEVKRLINEINRTYQAQAQALEKAKTDGETHAKVQAEQQRAAQETRARVWKEQNAALAEKYPNWFAPKEGDEEGNTLLDRGRALADLVFSPQDLTAEQIDLLPKAFAETIRARKPFSQEQIVRMHSIVRNKAMNHDRMAHRLHQIEAELAEAKESLKQYEESSPDGVPAGTKTKTGAAGFLEDASAELEALDRKFKV